MRSLLEKRILITIVSFALISIGIVLAIILPTLQNIKALDTETYNLRVTLERKNERIASYRRSLKQMEKIRSEMPPFADFLFLPGQELTLITTLENLASKNGVVQRIVSSNLDSPGQRIEMSLSATGPYNKAVNYLNELEKLPYFITVTNMQMSSFLEKNNPAAGQQVSMNIDLRLYVGQ